MTNWTNITKNTSSFSTVTKSPMGGGSTTVIGSPIGMLLSLTYATATSGTSGWTQVTKNTTAFTNIPKS